MRINTDYTQNSNITTNNNQTVTSEESFEDVLVLNQAALKAMAIDDMIDKSATGVIDPDAVTAAAVMNFKNTLPANIKAPEVDESFYKLASYEQSIRNHTAYNNSNNNYTNTICVPDVNKYADLDLSGVYNEGALKCSDELNAYFLEASKTYGIDVKLLKSIAYCESSFRPTTTSKSGAMGIMQLMPKTAEGLGVSNAYDPRQNILGGAKYISIQLERFNGSIKLALAAYNAGPGAVKKYNGVPPYEETQNYVVKVQKYYNM